MSTETKQTGDMFDRMYARLAGLGGKASSKCRDWRFKRDLASLERELARIIDVANGHSAKGQAKGSAVYFTLRDKAYSKIDVFCTKWTVDKEGIVSQMPALKDLDALTVAPAHMSPGVKLIAGFLGTVAALIMIGLASGVIQAGHNWAFHLLSH